MYFMKYWIVALGVLVSVASWADENPAAPVTSSSARPLAPRTLTLKKADGTPETLGITYDQSPPSTFEQPMEMFNFGVRWGPDGYFGAVPVGAGTYRYFGGFVGMPNCPPPEDKRWAIYGFRGTLDRVKGADGCRPVFGTGDAPRGWLFARDYLSGGQVIPFAAGGRRGHLMVFRGEYWWQNSQTPDHTCNHVACYYSSLGLAVSTDGGRTFRIVGEAAQLHEPVTQWDGGSTNRNFGYGSLVVADANGKHLENPPPDPANAYIYLFFVASAADLPGVCKWTACAGVARANYVDVVNAVLSGDPHAVARLFHKYSLETSDPWTTPATGDSPDMSVPAGRHTPLFSDEDGSDAVIYDRALDVYLMVSNTNHGANLRASKDLVHWTSHLGPPIGGKEPGRVSQYVQILGETGDPTIGGAEPRIYYKSKPEKGGVWRDTLLRVVKLKLRRP
jgi:hypothetical protein